MAKLLNGNKVAEEIRSMLIEDVKKLALKPVLAIIQVGGREDSNIYIRKKHSFAESVGAIAKHIQLPNTATQKNVCCFVSFSKYCF